MNHVPPAASPRPKDPYQYVRPRKRRFQARPYCEVEKTRYNLGSFPTPDQAAAAVREFWRTGRGERPRHVRRVALAGGTVFEAFVRVPLGTHPSREQAEAAAERYAVLTAPLALALWREAGGTAVPVDRRVLREASRDGWSQHGPPPPGVYVRAGRRGEWTGDGPPPPRPTISPRHAVTVLVRLGRYAAEAVAADVVVKYVRATEGRFADAILAGKERGGKWPPTGRGHGWSKGLTLARPARAAAAGAGVAVA